LRFELPAGRLYQFLPLVLDDEAFVGKNQKVEMEAVYVEL
jgi:hypothetical protein